MDANWSTKYFTNGLLPITALNEPGIVAVVYFLPIKLDSDCSVEVVLGWVVDYPFG
jgi:hypothetical protein